MSLLQLADVTLHSGRRSFFKLECDALSNQDWQAAAVMLARILSPFGRVEGVPRGGLPLALHLRHYADSDSGRILLVDDVWTTGGSMVDFANERYPNDRLRVIGAVLFARGPVHHWVTPLFTLDERLWAS